MGKMKEYEVPALRPRHLRCEIPYCMGAEISKKYTGGPTQGEAEGNIWGNCTALRYAYRHHGGNAGSCSYVRVDPPTVFHCGGREDIQESVGPPDVPGIRVAGARVLGRRILGGRILFSHCGRPSDGGYHKEIYRASER